jgi:hypothetical protein
MHRLWLCGEHKSVSSFLAKVGCAFMIVSWIVAGLGVIVSLIGYYMTPSAWGYGILGFGLAHIVLGILDMFRSPLRSR